MKTFEECANEGKIRKDPQVKNWVAKEIRGAENCIKSSEKILKIGVNDWAAISAYNALLHLNKALVFSNGYSVKGHKCLIEAVKKLFFGDYEIIEFASSIERGLESRNLIQYEGYCANAEQAEFMLNLARDYFECVKKTLQL